MKWKEPKWAQRRRLVHELRAIASLFDIRRQLRIAIVTNVLWLPLVALASVWQPLFQPNWTWWLGGLAAQTGYQLVVVCAGVLPMLVTSWFGMGSASADARRLAPATGAQTWPLVSLGRWRIARLSADRAALLLVFHARRRRCVNFVGLSEDADVRKIVALLRVARARAIRRRRKGKRLSARDGRKA